MDKADNIRKFIRQVLEEAVSFDKNGKEIQQPASAGPAVNSATQQTQAQQPQNSSETVTAEDMNDIIQYLEKNPLADTKWLNYAMNLVSEYQKIKEHDSNLAKKALGSIKKSNILGYIAIDKKKANNQEEIKMFDDIFKQYSEASDDYYASNDTKAMIKSVILSMMSSYLRKPRNKSDSNIFNKIYNEFIKNSISDHVANQKMIMLDMINITKFRPENQKYAEYFNKIFYEYEKDLNSSKALKSTWDLSDQIKKL